MEHRISERGTGSSPESIEEALEELEYRDKNEEDPDGRMTDLLPAPEDDFEDEAVATETEDDYSDESDADVNAVGTGKDNQVDPALDVDSASNTDGDRDFHLANR
nr:hypothetical protein [Armatimonas sp.]